MANVLVGHRAVMARQIGVGAAAALEVRANELIQIIDLNGQQVASFVAFGGEDRRERLSTATTVTANASIVLKTGDTLYGGNRTPLFEVVDDSVGRHDLLTGPLPPQEPTSSASTPQPTTLEGLRAAAADAGMPDADVSDPINWFKHVIIKQRGELEVKDSFSERNDTVVLRALTDAVVLVANAYAERRPGVTAVKTVTNQAGQLLVRVYS
ncbi:MAG TPA: urea carboxylase-associated family protein [Thermomicrobiales bacterium]|nr:urea carboxylase-associated family protein [Thermomicrobiales bacterium]